MIDIGLFAEDDGHRTLLVPIIQRVADAESVAIDIRIRSAQGGSGRALDALRRYSADLARGTDEYLAVLVVAIDGNCRGWNERRREIERLLGGFAGLVVVAIPDPHVELWYLADPQALPRVLGGSFTAVVPAQKCERHRYKQVLREACRQGGVEPVAGGVEYGEEVARQMDLAVAAANNPAFARFLDDSRLALRQAAATS